MKAMVVKPLCSFTNLALMFFVLFLVSDQMVAANGKKVKVNIGVVVENTEEVAGKRVLTAMRMALSDLYAANPDFETRLVLRLNSSRGDIVTSAAAVWDLINNVQVKAIIGPETSMEAQFDISLGDKAHVPIISYSATSPFLSSIRSHYFIQATQVDSAQVQAISSLIQAFGWRQVVPIYVDNEFGRGLIPNLTDALQQTRTLIPYQSAISLLATDDEIVDELCKLKSMATRVFIVHMEANLGTRLFSTAKKYGMISQDYVWIITNGIGNVIDTLSHKNIKSMQGVIGVRTYFNHTMEVENFITQWKRKILQENVDMLDPQITVFEIWAYDAITALARAVEQVGGTRFKFEKTNASSNGSSTNLSMIEISQAGQNLLRAIQGTRFAGLSGHFQLTNGQLRSSILEIVNVIGKGEKSVGFWTPNNGFRMKMKSVYDETYSTSKERLGSIIWPGDNKDPPKGWVIPTNGKKLRILVPIKAGFQQFVNVAPVPVSNETKITGYCIDIFNAAMKSLPYQVPYEYVPFTKPDGAPTDSYNELISEVYYKRYDAVVGDVTIVANRSSYVDFTLPYIDSSIVMIAPIKDDTKKMAWVFVTPFSWELWATILCYFVFIAFVIWVLEHPINPQFRGPAEYQVGVSLYCAVSAMVFHHSQHVFNNLARCVVIIWLFFGLILTQSYTASLTSTLTVKQLQPTVTDINELIRTRKVVGYQEGSFVKDNLIQKGFKDTNLKPFKRVEELHSLLKNGSQNGGIAAAFDEIPFIRVFLAKYGSEFMMVPSASYKNDGFGFVFPLGSPLVADVSHGVLNVTQGDQMVHIEKKWFRQQASWSEPSSAADVSSGTLRLESFKGLFIITGCAAACALILFLLRFLYEHRRVWLYCDPNMSLWYRVKELAKIFDQKNMESHAFNKGECQNTNHVGSSHYTRKPQSPSSISNHTDATSVSGCSDQPVNSGSPSP